MPKYSYRCVNHYFMHLNESADHQHFCEENIDTFLDLIEGDRYLKPEIITILFK